MSLYLQKFGYTWHTSANVRDCDMNQAVKNYCILMPAGSVQEEEP